MLRSRGGRIVPLAVLSILTAMVCASHAALSVCGNAVIAGDEECDDGGTCLGGDNAGTRCSADSACTGKGICIGGTHAGAACAMAAACPGGACRHCVPQGGDGCADNCTREHDVPFDMVPGNFMAGESVVQVLAAGVGVVPINIENSCSGGPNAGEPCFNECYGGTCAPTEELLTIGSPRAGRVPVVVKASSLRTPCINFYNLSVACVRGYPAQTCGGIVYEDDGATPAIDCTDGYTAGALLCAAAGKPPCTFVHGAGNTASGEIGCEGLDNANVTVVQDSGGSSGAAAPWHIGLGGHGGPGSASLLTSLRLSITTTGGTCHPSYCDPTFGPDCTFCTADDPQLISGPEGFYLPTLRATSPAVTGAATAIVQNANGMTASDFGPVRISGSPFDCAALSTGNAAGAGLVQAFPVVHLQDIGDVIITAQFFASTPVAVPPSSTPTATPTPLPPCIGDCDGSADVTIDELITMVNIALGATAPEACPEGTCDAHSGVIITCVIQAVGYALSACPGPSPTPSPTPPLLGLGHLCHKGNECDSGLCTDFVCCTMADCPQAQRCDITRAEGTCTPLHAIGEECERYFDCLEGLKCQFDSRRGYFVCAAVCVPDTPRPDITCEPAQCSFEPCRQAGRDGHCRRIHPNTGDCFCDTEGPTPTRTPTCPLPPLPTALPTFTPPPTFPTLTPTLTPTQTITPTPPSGRGPCRDSDRDCHSAFEFCLAPGAPAACGICVTDAMIEEQYRGCFADVYCSDREPEWVCEPLGTTAGTCLPCSGPKRVCLPPCTQRGCGTGQVCKEGHCVGNACGADVDCPPAFTCARQPGDASGRCARRSCTDDGQCDGAFCVNFKCYETLGQCVPSPL